MKKTPGSRFNTYFTEIGKVLDRCLERIKEGFINNNEPIIHGEFGSQNCNSTSECVKYYARQALVMRIFQLW